MKNKIVYNPDQIYSIIMNAKVSGEHYILKEIQQSDIFDIKELVEPKKWLQDKTGEKVRWSDVMEVHVSHTRPDSLLFKYNFDDEYSEIDFNVPTAGRSRQQRRGRTQQQESRKVDSIQLKLAYDKPLPISKALYDDLQTLCNSQAIPRNYHEFYNDLTYFNNSVYKEDSD